MSGERVGVREGGVTEKLEEGPTDPMEGSYEFRKSRD